MGKSSRRLPVALSGARVVCFALLDLFLSISSNSGVSAVTLALNGFQKDSARVVPASSWVFDTATACYFFDPLQSARFWNISGRFLYPGFVPMKAAGATSVKSFSTSFIYQILIEYDNTYTGPGMAFIIVPDNSTVGAPIDYMGLLTNSKTAKNSESDDHTLGVELDKYMNPEFQDPNDNHIGINLGSMNSTYALKPNYSLTTDTPYLYQQLWLDYFETDSRMDISYAKYGQGKPAKPQGSQSDLNLSSLLKANMYIGFSTANEGTETSNVPAVCAWSFSNDGTLAPPIVLAQDASPPAPPPPPGPNPPAPPHSVCLHPPPSSCIIWNLQPLCLMSGRVHTNSKNAKLFPNKSV